MKGGTRNRAYLSLSLSFSLRDLGGGNQEGGSFTVEPENMLRKDLEMDVRFHMGPTLGENE